MAALVCLSVARPAAALRGDADCNGQLADVTDLPAVIAAPFERGPCADADVNGDHGAGASDVTAEVRLLNAAAQRPAFDQVLDQITPDGIVTLDTARQMFQLTYGGLDGVTVPGGPVGGNVDGTIALETMLQHQDDLSDADAARLDQVVDVNGPVSATIQPAATIVTSSRKHLHSAFATRADVTLPDPLPSGDPSVQNFVDRIEVWLPQLDLQAQLPFTLPIDVAVYAVALADAAADTLTFDANGGGGAPARCRIRFYQAAIDESSADQDNTVVHELWHCFEAVIVGDRDTAFGESKWIVEGQAEYVAAFLTKTEAPPFASYLSLPAFPLFARTYSAVGFYVTMENDGAAMFPALKTMLLTGSGSNELAFDAALSATPRLLQTWGEQQFEVTSHGADWDYLIATGLPPPASDDIPGAVHLDMGDGTFELVQVPAYSVFLWKVNLTTDLIHFQIPGTARLLDQAGGEFNDLSDVWLCQHQDPDQCKCPQGSDGQAPESQSVTSPMDLAASAGDTGVFGTMTSISLDQLCKQKKPPETSAFCDDARNLQASINQFAGGDLEPTTLRSQLQADVYWLGLMAKDAPADIVAAMQPVADAYVQANGDFASEGYQVVPTSEADELAIQAGLMAVTSVAAQSVQVGAYVAQVCGFQFSINSV